VPIAFRALTQIASGGATDPTSAPALPTGTQVGDMVVYGVIVKYAATTIATNPPTGWQDPANNEANNTGLTDSGNDAGNIRAALFFREYDGVWTMPTIDLSGLPNITMVGAASYSKGADETWDTPVCATAVDDTIGSTGIDPPASGTTIDFVTGDWFGAFAAVNGDVGTPTVPMTATVSGVTFGAATTRWNGTTSGGTDLRGHSIDQTYTSGTASAGPDGGFTLTTGGANGAGVMVFFRLRLVADSSGWPTLDRRMPGRINPDLRPYLPGRWPAPPDAGPAAEGDATVNPATIALAATVPQSVVSVGVTPATIAQAFTVPQSAVDVGAAPAVIARQFDVPQVTADGGGGAANVTPAVIAQAFAIPQVAVSVDAASAVLARAFVVPQAAVSVGVTPAAIARAFVVPQAAVSVGVAPSVIALAFVVPQVTADGGAAGDATATPAVIARAFVIPQTAVSVGAAPTTLTIGLAFPAFVVLTDNLPIPSGHPLIARSDSYGVTAGPDVDLVTFDVHAVTAGPDSHGVEVS